MLPFFLLALKFTFEHICWILCPSVLRGKLVKNVFFSGAKMIEMHHTNLYSVAKWDRQHFLRCLFLMCWCLISSRATFLLTNVLLHLSDWRKQDGTDSKISATLEPQLLRPTLPHSTSPVQKVGGSWGGGGRDGPLLLWPLAFSDGPPSDPPLRKVCCMSVLVSLHLLLSWVVESLHILIFFSFFFFHFDFRDASVLPSLGSRQTIFTVNLLALFLSFCSIKTYKTQPVSDNCQVNQKFIPPPLSSVCHQIGKSLISRLCGSI